MKCLDCKWWKRSHVISVGEKIFLNNGDCTQQEACAGMQAYSYPPQISGEPMTARTTKNFGCIHFEVNG